MIQFHTVTLNSVPLHYGQVAGPEAVRERAVQLHQLDAVVLEPALTGTLFGADEPDDLLAQIRCPVHLLAAQFSLGGALTLSA